MALDRNKVQALAQKHLAKGNYDKAIVEYRRLVEENPHDFRTWLKIGDLYTRQGDRRGATETYGKVAEHYAAQGFHLKAVAVYKQILKLDPTRLDVFLTLGDMYVALDLRGEALASFEKVASTHWRAGEHEQALALLLKMTEVDPGNIPIRIRYAEALAKLGQIEPAAREFEAAATRLDHDGRLDDYMKVAERLLYLRPSDVALARRLAQMYLERNDPKRALAKLQVCFKTDSKDVMTLGYLAEAFHQLEQTPKTISVYREIARIHQEAGRQAERKDVLRRILELDPNDTDARAAYDAYAPEPAVVEAPRLSDTPEIIAEDLDEDDSAFIDDDDDVIIDPDSEDILIVDEDEPVEAHEVEPARPSIVPRASMPPADLSVEAKAARMLAECEVFARYGLKDKILAQLEHVVELVPTLVEAREKLKEAYLEAGRTDDAVDQLHVLASLFETTQPALAQLYYRQVLAIDPEHPEARASLRNSLVPEAPPPETQVVEARAPEPEPPTAEAPLPPEPERDILAPISPAEFEAGPLREHASEEAALPRGGAASASELQQVLDEVDFYLAQTLWDEARETLEDALEIHADHPLLLDKLEEVNDAEAAHAERPPAPAASADDDESFALAEKLAAELSAVPEDAANDALDLDQVFAQFKRGVEEQIEESDSETHYDLGIAYKEMGLIDDAIHEFGLARSNPERACIAETMIGICHLEQGRFDAAVEHFERGLASPRKSAREELGLYYELGNAYERRGAYVDALSYFRRVQVAEPSFRGIEERIRRVEGRAAEGSGPARLGRDDVDQAFDDLFGDEE